MMIKDLVELGNGMTAVDVLDTSSGLISRYLVETGRITQLMKELREK